MNQTLLRLEMIKMAISVGDFDVVHQLHLKIALLTHDESIQRIAEALHAKNYVLAQRLIDAYLENPPEEHLQTVPFEDEESLKEAFELFESRDDSDTQETSSADPNLFDEAFMPDTVSDESDEKESYDDLFTTPEEDEPTGREEATEEPSIFDLPPIDEPVPHYDKIPYIEQKYLNLKTQYPPLVERDTLCDEARTWMEHIAAYGCSETDVETRMEIMLRLKEEEKKAEAAQLLLITAGVPSLYAEYMLARELFRGEVLEENRPESFAMMQRLAENENYGEALCDLAQFYEYGIETKKDTKKAEQLYKEAMHRGIKRAEKHYMRLHKANRRFFSFLG